MSLRWIGVLLLVGCSSDARETKSTKSTKPTKPVPTDATTSQPSTWAVQGSTQRTGDPEKGRIALLGENYIGCGVPDALMKRLSPFSPTPMQGRAPSDQDLPYFLNRYETADGVKMLTANCLGCHAAYRNGELVIGLGETSIDYTVDPTMPLSMLARMTSGAERRELDLLRSRVGALYPSIVMPSVGPNPADHIAAVLFAHRDPETLAWSDKPLMEVPSHSPTPVDVPAWWMMKKKNAMFYTAAGRGDHARIMMTASALCTDSIAQAEAIDRYFPDVRAFIASLEAPPYPHPIDNALAAAGKVTFESRCARCHGTYDEDPSKETYPNLVVGLETIGTDPSLAVGSGQFAGRFVEWFNKSFYGKTAQLVPQPGYIAPPLDGVWATAPYFHNGSVPTLAAVIDSNVRPSRWRRDGLRSSSYDSLNPGWKFTVAEKTDESLLVYDTSRKGYSASGHTFGDSLSAEQRMALLEYLKSL